MIGLAILEVASIAKWATTGEAAGYGSVPGALLACMVAFQLGKRSGGK